jgi:lysophospholipase L1-like esterase
VISKLQQTYNTEIIVKNKSVGGKQSVWGKENVRNLVSSETPDLVVIAFGMGDAHKSIDIKTEVFKNNIQFMMDDVKSVNPEAEFILVSTMLANPESTGFAGRQAEYLPVLESLKAVGVAIADITSVHIKLLNHKNYRDITGNNLNHPGDFLARWYAQVVSALLVKE